MPRSSTLRPRCIAKAESIRSFFRAARARGPATCSPASRSTWRRARLVSATEAARMLPTSTTSSNRKIPRSTAWTAPFARSSSFCTGLRKRTRRERHLFPYRRRPSCWRQSKLSLARILRIWRMIVFLPPTWILVCRCRDILQTGSWFSSAESGNCRRPSRREAYRRLAPPTTPHFDRHCDLAFAGDLRLHLHSVFPIPYFAMGLLTLGWFTRQYRWKKPSRSEEHTSELQSPMYLV